MSKQEQIDLIRAIVKEVKFAMMTTVTDEGHLHACPMTTSETSLGAREVWFIGDKTSEAVADIDKNPQANLSYVSQDGKDYVSINGVAELVEDQTKLDELWSPMNNAFFEHGKEDENVQLIKVVPNGAEYWRTGNSLVNAAKLAAAALQDGKVADSLGENGSVEFD